MYTLFIRYSTGTLFEIPFVSASYTDELNTGKNATFSLEYKALKDIADTYNTTVEFILTGGYREIYIEKDSTKIYYGVITDYSLMKNDTGFLTISISSVDFFVLLGKRFTDDKQVYSSTEASEIAWDLINTSQLSDTYADLGITQGTTITSKDRDRTYRFANIKEAIAKLSNANLNDGFDFDINNLKQFNCYYPSKGSNRAEIVLDEVNIINWQYRRPALLSLTNKVYVIGAGFNDDVLFVTRESANTYKSAFTLLENTLSERDIITSDTLNDKGDKYLLENQSPRPELTIYIQDNTPDILNYDIGDNLKIKIDELNFNNVYKRLYKRSVSISSENQAIVTLNFK